MEIVRASCIVSLRRIARFLGEQKQAAPKRFGIAWQRDFFDHRLRSARAVREKAEYIHLNPVRAGLVETPAAWPYVWRLADAPSGPSSTASSAA